MFSASDKRLTSIPESKKKFIHLWALSKNNRTLGIRIEFLGVVTTN